MSKERLIVKNFGPIKEVDINLAKVTVFIGEQASGKSVLAKLAAFLSNPMDTTEREDAYMTDWFTSGLFEFNIVNFLQDDTSASFENDEFIFGINDNRIPFKTFSDERLRILFSKVNEIQETKRRSEVEFLSARRSFTEAAADQYFKNQELFLNQLSDVYTIIKKIFPEPIYIPTERNLISILSLSLYNLLKNDVALPDFVKVFGSKFESSRKNVKEVYIPSLKLKYSYSENDDKIILENGKQINLVESSSGVQSIVPLSVVIEAASKNGKHLFIVEEPELNLYPTTQKALVEYLIEKCTHGDNRLIITTHSPYILTALNNCIQAQNVVDVHPESAEEVNKIIPSRFHLKYEDVIAYYVGGGTAKPIMDDETQMIDANKLDDVSDELAAVFDKLLDLKYQNQD